MNSVGFLDTWMQWIEECICTPTFSVILNSSPQFSSIATEESRKVILSLPTQGDPFAPLHLCLGYGILVNMFGYCTHSEKNSYVKIGPHNYVTHLLFPNNMLVFVKANKSSIKEIILTCYVTWKYRLA